MQAGPGVFQMCLEIARLHTLIRNADLAGLPSILGRTLGDAVVGELLQVERRADAEVPED